MKFFALVLAVASLFAVPVFAADTVPCGSVKAEWCAGLYTGTVGVITRGEKREFITARATASGPFSTKLSGFGRADLTGSQDGGAINIRDPHTFRTVEASGGLRYKVGGIVEASVIAGATYSVEGDAGKPVDARLFTLAALARVPIGDGGYAYVGAGHHGPVGGRALLFAASIPLKGGTYSIIDFAFPLQRNVLQEKTWVLKVGASIRVKTIRLVLP